MGDPDIHFVTLEKENTLATHAVAHFLRGVSTEFKFSLAYFAITTALSFKLMSLLYEAISIIELQRRLYIIATTSDGVSPNKRSYRLQKLLDDNPNSDIYYRSVIFFVPIYLLFQRCIASHKNRLQLFALFSSR